MNDSQDKILVIIPARGNSKRLPDKNIKLLAGKPLIAYSIECARDIAQDQNICVSTDSLKIVEIVENLGLKVPFLRPEELAGDDSSTNSVINHALEYYKNNGKNFDVVILLQPTSPLRKACHVQEALALYTKNLEMVVSVKPSKSPSVLCQEDQDGYLKFTFNKTGKRSQEFENYFEYNGAVYVINVHALSHSAIHEFQKVRKYVMDEISSIDIDDPFDFILAEQAIKYAKQGKK